jgi:hypothetical protein
MSGTSGIGSPASRGEHDRVMHLLLDLIAGGAGRDAAGEIGRVDGEVLANGAFDQDQVSPAARREALAKRGDRAARARGHVRRAELVDQAPRGSPFAPPLARLGFPSD